MRHSAWTRSILLVLVCGSAFGAQAQGTAFTYQGRLDDNGSPANGRYDFIFQVFDASSGGNSVGGAVNPGNVAVSNGLFTVVLDFGSSPFTGPPRWLQIGVSSNGAGNFTTLSPRQEITHAPYATYANLAATVTNGAIANAQLAVNSVGSVNLQNNAVRAGQIASGQVVKSLNGLSDGVSITQGANVTINTVGNSLQISAPAGGLALPFSGSASNNNSVFTLANSGTGAAGVFLGNVGIGATTPASRLTIDTPIAGDGVNLRGGAPGYSLSDAAGNHHAVLGYAGGAALYSADAVAGDTVLRTETGSLLMQNGTGASDVALKNHRVGIGTPTPQAKLDVRGDIKLGANGQLNAAGGEENLRIVRGTFDADGSRTAGSGFSVAHPGVGEYSIRFNTPFTGMPVVTLNAYRYVNGDAFVSLNGTFSNLVDLVIINTSNDLDDHPVSFIAIGPR